MPFLLFRAASAPRPEACLLQRGCNRAPLLHLTPGAACTPLCLKNMTGVHLPADPRFPLPPFTGWDCPHQPTQAATPCPRLCLPGQCCAARENGAGPAENGQEAPAYVGLPGRVLLLLEIPCDHKTQVVVQAAHHTLGPTRLQ